MSRISKCSYFHTLSIDDAREDATLCALLQALYKLSSILLRLCMRFLNCLTQGLDYISANFSRHREMNHEDRGI